MLRGAGIRCGFVQAAPIPHNGDPSGWMRPTMTLPDDLEDMGPYADPIPASCMMNRPKPSSHHHVSLTRHHVPPAGSTV